MLLLDGRITMNDWIAELPKVIANLVAIKLLHCLARTLPRLREPTVSNYYRHCYYPGSTLMSIVCWCKHPISAARRAEAEFNAGWNWPDPDDIAFRIG